MSATGVSGGDRHTSIDAVRGMAVLGILLMNIVGMGMPTFAYVNPSYWGGFHGADLAVWAVNNVLTDGKMRALFTMLFGASTVLIADRATGQRPGPIATHYGRMFWLLLFGMAHAYLLWWGDILVAYAIAGLVIFPFRKLNPMLLIGIGLVILAGLIAKDLIDAGQMEVLRAAATAPGASAAAIKAWQDASVAVQAPADLAAAEIAGFRGTFMSALHARAYVAMLMQLVIDPTDAIPEAIGQMLIGMALFRLGFFTLRWSSRAYAGVVAFGYLVAAPLTAWLAWMIWQSGFEPLVLHRLEVWQAASRPFIALAHASVLLLIIRSGALTVLVNRLTAAGRMAFSNYLITSIITTLVFCGFGLGLYGQLSRFQQLAVVAAVWVFILAWSRPWLERFHYGPFEWLWRTLVRWKPQPFRKAVAA